LKDYVIHSFLKLSLIFLIGLAIAVMVTKTASYFIVLTAVMLVLGLCLVRNLQVGLLMYFFIAALAFGESPAVQSPHSEYKAGLMPSEVFLAFLGMLWLGRALFTERPKLIQSELNIPLLSLVGVSFLSLITANVFVGTRELLFHQMLITQVAEVGLLCFSVLAYLLAANVFRDERYIRLIPVPIVLLALYFCGHQIFGLNLPVPIPWGNFILAAAIGIVYAIILFGEVGRLKVFGLSILLGILMYAAYIDLSWVSGWVAVSGVILVVSFLRSKWLAIVLLAIGIFAMFVWPGVYDIVHEESGEKGDFDRFTIWLDAFRMFTSVNPFLGIGPGNYHHYVYYYNTIWFSGKTYTTAHSNYVQVASELGLIGLGVFLWVILVGIRMGIRIWRTSTPEMKWLGATATGVLASMAVTSIFGDYLFPSRGNNGIVNFGTTVYTWLLMGTAVASTNLRLQEKEKDDLEGRCDR
jgi:O-antigen ligase